ncbi:MAG: alanine racemase [Clostridia bacterium]|nr:alanine racemase [Clostridia bacterium]
MKRIRLPLRGAWIEIDLMALRHNFNRIRELTGDRTMQMPVIKADAYGHGAVRCAKTLLRSGAGRLAIATLEEGVALRKAGVGVPILCLGYLPPRQYEAALVFDLTLTVYHYQQAEKISAAAAQLGKTALVHIKVDSGFTRLGFDVSEESALQVARIKALPGIQLEGVYSHFAAADSREKEFSHHQNTEFNRFLALCREQGVTFPIRHIANSAAMLELPEYRYELCRPGILLYGCQPADDMTPLSGLRPVMSVRAEIARLMRISPGTAVGYGCTWVATRDSVIATLPLGYADGISRLLARQGSVLVHGQRAPIVGRICMDQFMIDVTDIQSAEPLQEGDIATIMGEDKGGAIRAEELAERMGTINYEILCMLGNRLPRVYLSKNAPFTIS